MKKPVFMAAFAGGAIFSLALFSQNFAYVGAKKCQICHKTEKQGMQYPIWEKSLHFKSAAALTSAMAGQMAQTLGITGPLAENEKCQKCHAPLFQKAPDLKNEGVTCEACHGPGSEYKKLSLMQNREEALKNGLTHLQNQEEIQKSCLACHENSHGIKFDFAAAHEKIKHLIPRSQ